MNFGGYILSQLLHVLHSLCTAALLELSPNISASDPLLVPEITRATNPRFGHYQCNNALKIAKVLGESPRILAEKLVSKIMNHPEAKKFSSISVAGPGFVNFTFSPNSLSQFLLSSVKKGALDLPQLGQDRRVIVEFSSPNIAKELHVGHLRSTIIGDSIARLLESVGFSVLRLNHIGDWGTQFGMLIAYIRRSHLEPQILDSALPLDPSVLTEWYRLAKECFDGDEHFRAEAHDAVVCLQAGDPSCVLLWQRICVLSRKSFSEIYSLLDIHIQERGESFYNQWLPDVVQDLERQGLVTISDNAKCVFLEGFVGREGNPLPVIVQKSDGGFNYSTTDVAAMRHRALVEGVERIVVVTDAGQALHFQMVSTLCRKAGYLPSSVQFDHVTFGVVLGQDGKKFKTRSGKVEKLVDLLTQAIARAEDIFQERMPDAGRDVWKKMGAILGIDAVKYADLATHRQKDYTFSYDRMLRFEGNTAPFLLYSFVRTKSLERKVGYEGSLGVAQLELEHPSEIDLAVHLLRFNEVLEQMVEDLLPHRLCDYLFGLAEQFNAFFRDCRVDGSAREQDRMFLCKFTQLVFEQGFFILGLQTLDVM